MTLILHYHPFAAFCWKTLIALYENDTLFDPLLVDLGDDESREAFYKLWPIGRFPVIEDRDRGRLIPESTIIIEYLGIHYPGPSRLIPTDPDEAIEARFRDRFFDLYIAEPMQKVVADTLRPEGAKDPAGVEIARDRLAKAYGIADKVMESRTWAAGEAFTIADCAAAPALFYADWVMPLGARWPSLATYLTRLLARPSVARTVDEARPYRHFMPLGSPPRESQAFEG